MPPTLLDGDNLRHGLNGDLGFGADDRAENVRRAGEVARLFADAGVVALVPLISPYRADAGPGPHGPRAGRPALRRGLRRHAPSRSASSATPRASTPRPGPARSPGFTGIDDPYEAPDQPDLVLTPDDGGVLDQATLVVAALVDRDVIAD